MKKYSNETVVGIFIIVGLLCLGYMSVKLGKVSVFGDDAYALYAKFNSVSGIRPREPTFFHRSLYKLLDNKAVVRFIKAKNQTRTVSRFKQTHKIRYGLQFRPKHHETAFRISAITLKPGHRIFGWKGTPA